MTYEKFLEEITTRYNEPLAMVKQNGLTLKSVTEQTPEICLVAIEQTVELCLTAVSQDKMSLPYVDKNIFV